MQFAPLLKTRPEQRPPAINTTRKTRLHLAGCARNRLAMTRGPYIMLISSVELGNVSKASHRVPVQTDWWGKPSTQHKGQPDGPADASTSKFRCRGIRRLPGPRDIRREKRGEQAEHGLLSTAAVSGESSDSPVPGRAFTAATIEVCERLTARNSATIR